MNEGIEKGGRGLTHASAGLVAQADEAEAHLLAGSPPLFVFPGSLMLGTGSWDSCALSADILGRVVFRGVTSSNVKKCRRTRKGITRTVVATGHISSRSSPIGIPWTVSVCCLVAAWALQTLTGTVKWCLEWSQEFAGNNGAKDSV